jgi:hypothetical protein
MDGVPTFRAFVVGHEIAPKTSRQKDILDEGVVRGRVMATTFGQLTRHANQRLFKLREKIPTRYDEISGADLMARVMQTPTQVSLALPIENPSSDKDKK